MYDEKFAGSIYVCVSVQFIRSVVSDSLRPRDPMNRSTPGLPVHMCVCIYIYINISCQLLFLFCWTLLMRKKNKYYLLVKHKSKSYLKILVVKLLIYYSGARQHILDHIWFNDMGIGGRKV